MKRILAALLIVGLASSFAWADWLTNFNDTYNNKNINAAVEDGLKEGITPDVIVEKSMALPGINPQNVVEALYCAGIGGQDVYEAAAKAHIAESVVTAGFKKSVEKCGDKVVDTEPYTPGDRGPGRSFGPPRTSPGKTFASPDKFAGKF
ncbi:hypothetical protein [Desulfocastanea catecholica]